MIKWFILEIEVSEGWTFDPEILTEIIELKVPVIRVLSIKQVQTKPL
jgi:hypothetical protein